MRQQIFYDAISQSQQQFFDALQEQHQTPLIQRKPKLKQTPYVWGLNKDNTNMLKLCIDNTSLVDDIVNLCINEKIVNIFIVDGPNMGYNKSDVFNIRQLFLSGKSFRKILIENSIKSELNLFIIISQKTIKKGIKPKCNERLSVSKVVKQSQHFFINIKVACYDKKRNERCLMSNETDDYTRKYIAALLLIKFRQLKIKKKIYEITNDNSKNWLIDKKFRIDTIKFPINLFENKSLYKKNNPSSIYVWKKKPTTKTIQSISKNAKSVDPTPSLTKRPMLTHSNMPLGKIQEFGINQSVVLNLIDRWNKESSR